MACRLLDFELAEVFLQTKFVGLGRKSREGVSLYWLLQTISIIVLTFEALTPLAHDCRSIASFVTHPHWTHYELSF